MRAGCSAICPWGVGRLRSRLGFAAELFDESVEDPVGDDLAGALFEIPAEFGDGHHAEVGDLVVAEVGERLAEGLVDLRAVVDALQLDDELLLTVDHDLFGAGGVERRDDLVQAEVGGVVGSRAAEPLEHEHRLVVDGVPLQSAGHPGGGGLQRGCQRPVDEEQDGIPHQHGVEADGAFERGFSHGNGLSVSCGWIGSTLVTHALAVMG